MTVDGNVRPMRFGKSAIVFVVVTLMGIACFYGLRPYLVRVGWGTYLAYLSSLSVVFLVMLVWALTAYIVEGQPRTWKSFRQRYRLGPVNPRVLLWATALGAIMFLSTAAFAPLLSEAILAGVLPLPPGLPDYLNPVRQLSIAALKDQFVSQGVLLLVPFVLVLNILAEELFWRGMILPRQERAHGSRTYLVHGLFWAFSHLFQYWMLLPILIGSLALSWIVQRSRNTWVGIMAHLLNNALPFAIMLVLAC